ncbi:Rab GTPase [Pelomyxa schiedti]|nr:Rab GTPase [Pelomyxa schiedti]
MSASSTPTRAVLLKVVLIGPRSVGKTTLMKRYVTNAVNIHEKNTVGVDVLTKKLVVGDRQVSLQIWDTAGQERFQCMTASFWKGADCCVLVFDVTDQETFNSMDQWYGAFLSSQDKTIPPCILFGNKTDATERRIVTRQMAESWCTVTGNIPYYETSALTGNNVDNAFQTVANTILNRREETYPEMEGVRLEADRVNTPHSCC